jgi:hypothetical protein
VPLSKLDVAGGRDDGVVLPVRERFEVCTQPWRAVWIADKQAPVHVKVGSVVLAATFGQKRLCIETPAAGASVRAATVTAERYGKCENVQPKHVIGIDKSHILITRLELECAPSLRVPLAALLAVIGALVVAAPACTVPTPG